MSTVFRRARPEDAPAIAEVYLRSFRHAYDGSGVRLAHGDDDVRRWVCEQLLPGHVVTVAEEDGAIAGYVAEEPGWVSHLYLEPTCIGRGVGSALLRLAMEHQPDGLDLWTFQVNLRARTFYERHGFVAVELTDGAGNEERQPDVRYHWPA